MKNTKGLFRYLKEIVVRVREFDGYVPADTEEGLKKL